MVCYSFPVRLCHSLLYAGLSRRTRLDLAPPLADRFVVGFPPSITARYFSSCPSDSTSRWTPCPPENRWLVALGPPWLVSSFRFRARVDFSIPSTFSGPRGITLLPHYHGAVRPWLKHRYFRPHGSFRLHLSLTIASQVLKFRTKAQMRFTPPLHRTPYGQ